MENIYTQAVMSGDLEAIKYSLKGIIKCRKLLGEDYKIFEKEYESYTFPEDNNIETTISHDNISKNISTEKIGKINREKSIIKSKIISKHENKIKNHINRLKKINIDKNVIEIFFDKKLSAHDIAFFELNYRDKFRYIYDIKAILPKWYKKKLHMKNIKNIKLSQNSKEKIRLVLENNNKFDAKAYFNKNKIVIIVKNDNFIDRVRKSIKPKKRVKKSNRTVKKRAIRKYSKLIVIDPGHGGNDSGAVGYNRYKEKNIVLSIALKLRKILKKRGYKVYMTRSRDKTIDIHYRPNVINRTNADLLISIHANSIKDRKNFLTVKGIETYYLSPADSPRAKRVLAREDGMISNADRFSKNTLLNFINREKINKSKYLAIDIQSNVIYKLRKKYSAIIDHSVRAAPLWVLSAGKMPGILIEVGYITNPIEARRLVNPLYQKTLATGIADGIDSYFVKND